MFVIVGLFVAVIVLWVVSWNALWNVTYWKSQYLYMSGMTQKENREVVGLRADNDSLYKANDSITRKNVDLRTQIDKSSTIVVGGDQSNVIRDNTGSVNATIKKH